MPTLHVRNVPEELYERLQERAQKENRSMSAEVVDLLQRAIEASERSPAEILAGIRRRRSFRTVDAGAPDSVTLIREDREG